MGAGWARTLASKMPPCGQGPDKENVYPSFYYSPMTPLLSSEGFVRQLEISYGTYSQGPDYCNHVGFYKVIVGENQIVCTKFKKISVCNHVGFYKVIVAENQIVCTKFKKNISL